tara:strand:+ start:33 stop:395 length:363 start_codon:yes stop_codon:yes gene_type:complete
MDKWQALQNVLKDDHENVLEEFWSDEEFVFHACHWNGHNFKFAHPILKNKKEFVLKIIKYWGYSFEYADQNLKKDKTFILNAVKFNASIIKHIDPTLKNDKNFVNQILKNCKYASNYLES